MERITKRAARAAHCKGEAVYILPNRVRIDNFWMRPYRLYNNVDFDKQVDAYSYYNCMAETGTRVAFYREG